MNELAKQYRARARDVQTIAEGIYDEAERRKLLEFARDYETWALASEDRVTGKQRRG
jgi:hypothetical protein